MRFRLLLLLLLCVVGVNARVKTGIETLRDSNFSPLHGKRVGLVTNPTGVDSDLLSTIDILASSPEVNLVALFAPEHGVRGDVPAGRRVASTRDSATGIPVSSLYGANRKPSAASLKGIDVLVYDIQDIGCRSYTFISTLGKLIEACAENGVPLMVLDRPNPLGGEKVEGPFGVEPDCISFVSQYSIPYIYGLTPGELARYLNGEVYGGRCDLSVVEMTGWNRNMTFEETGLPWVPTSPNIPTAETAFYYPATGIMGELGPVGIGANFTLPFKVAVAENFDAEKLSKRLSALNLPGVLFRPCYLKISGKQLKGVQIYVVEPQAAELTMVQFYIMQELAAMGIDVMAGSEASRLVMFDNVCGSKALRRAFQKRGRAADVAPLVKSGKNSWLQAVKPYLLY